MLWSANVSVSDEASYSFTQPELARLIVYRAAVRVGFYNELGPEAAQPALASKPDQQRLSMRAG